MSELQFAVTPKAGEAFIRERALFVEAGANLEDPAALGVMDRVRSVHGPASYRPGTFPRGDEGSCRLHWASTVKDVRDEAIRQFEAFVERARATFPQALLITTHSAPHRFPDPPIRPGPGEPVPRSRPDLARWDLLVEAIRRFGRWCSEHDFILAVENNWAYWTGVPEDADVASLTPDDFMDYFCTSPEEWLRLPKKVNDPNVVACLDPSHATPYCQRFVGEDERRRMLDTYLSDMSALGHLHWNDSDILTDRGREDLHLAIGEGNLGRSFHARLKAWGKESGRPVLLEHFHGPESFDREMRFIEELTG